MEAPRAGTVPQPFALASSEIGLGLFRGVLSLAKARSLEVGMEFASLDLGPGWTALVSCRSAILLRDETAERTTEGYARRIIGVVDGYSEFFVSEFYRTLCTAIVEFNAAEASRGELEERDISTVRLVREGLEALARLRARGEP